jgi:hypothetical protein
LSKPDQTYLDWYFENHWHSARVPKYSSATYTAELISDDERVLDVGAGYNPHRGLIKNLVTFDPAMDACDYRLHLDEFLDLWKAENMEAFDVAICYGSVNFGGYDHIDQQIAEIAQMLKPKARIFWRCNMGFKDHFNPHVDKVEFFPWSMDYHRELSAKHGFAIEFMEYDDVDEEADGVHHRIFAIWSRP